MLTLLVALTAVVLAGLEWWKGGRALRLVAAAFALVVLFLAPTIPWRAARRALDVPAAERLTAWPGGGRPLSEYESGVLTMHRMVVDDARIGANARMVGVGLLVWLAVSPALRGRRPEQLASVGTVSPPDSSPTRPESFPAT